MYSSKETILDELDSIVEKAKRVDIRIQPILSDIKVLRSIAAISTEDNDIQVQEAAHFLQKLKAIVEISSPFIPVWLNSKEAQTAKKVILGAAEAIRKQKATGDEIEEHWQPTVLQYKSEEIKERCISVIKNIIMISNPGGHDYAAHRTPDQDLRRQAGGGRPHPPHRAGRDLRLHRPQRGGQDHHPEKRGGHPAV